MANKKNKFSAFKLFYDEFIYKQNNAVAYNKVDSYLENIRNLTIEIRRFPKFDLNSYTVKLDENNKLIRSELNSIFDSNKNLFEYYYFLYKSKVENCNDNVEDMPFVVACSFYDDYRLDNKSVEDLESNSNTVPKYSSLEKREIRNSTKDKTRLEYLLELLSSSKCSKVYEKFINKINDLMLIKPMYNEIHFDYFNRIDKFILEVEGLYPKLEEKAKKRADFEYVSDMMQIAFRKKFENWTFDLKEIVTEHFDEVYNRFQKKCELKNLVNGGNDISFETYLDIVDELIREKEYYLELFENGKFVTLDFNDDTDFTKFKEVLANAFFDKRYLNTIDDNSGVKDCVNRAVELYRLAEDLNDQIFERIMFDSSHSDALRRNGDVKSAIIRKIYDLYNPVYLLRIYDDVRKEFEKVLLGKNFEFKRDYNTLLTEQKRKYNFHGPIPTMAFIRTKIVERKRSFILEHCITELKSRDILGNYDTRNYDLTVMTRDISVEDMVSLYEKMKYKIANFNYNSMKVNDKSFVNVDLERNMYLAAAQEFVVNDLLEKLNLKANTLEEKIRLYNHICDDYLNENLIFVDYNFSGSSSNKLEIFYRSKDEFNKKSKWSKLNNKNK